MSVRLGKVTRPRMILHAAVRVAHDQGLENVNHETVSQNCPIETSAGTVRRYFPRQVDLWRACSLLDPSLMDKAREIGAIE